MSALNKGDEDDPGNTQAFLNLADFNTLLSDRDSEMGEPAAGTINIQGISLYLFILDLYIRFGSKAIGTLF